MHRLFLLFTFLLSTLFLSSSATAKGTATGYTWLQNDTVIKHIEAEFKTTFRVWLRNETSSQLMMMVKQEGDVSAFKVKANQTGYPLGTLFNLAAKDSVWFDIEFESDPGQMSFLTTLLAINLEDTAKLVLASLYSPPPAASWEVLEVVMIAPNCQTAARGQAFLINNGVVDVQIDSVRIVEDPTNSFYIESTSPQNRLRDFIIGPGGGSVTYNIIFAPSAGSKEERISKIMMYGEGGLKDSAYLHGIVGVSMAEVSQTTISLGVQQLETDIEYSAVIDNSGGTGNFVVSAVEVLGEIGVTLQDLDVDTVVEAQSVHLFRMTFRGITPGEKQAQILIFGSPCDPELAITVGAEFEEKSSVKVDARTSVRLVYVDRYLRIEHNSVTLPYRILDITGRTVSNGSAETGARVDLANLLTGTYFAILETPDGPVSEKFVKR